MATPSPFANFSLAKMTLWMKLAAGGAAVAIWFILYYVVIHTDIGTKIDAANRTSKALDGDLSAQRQSQASYFQDRDELVMRQQRQRELNKILPADTEVASFLSSIQQVSNVSGIDLKAWQPQEEINQAFYAKVPMRLDFSGRFHQIAKFVYEVGKLDRIINVENIDLGDPKADGDDVVLKGHCLATTFHTSIKKPEVKK
jgi:type IV pilus assembly protein PilO